MRAVYTEVIYAFLTVLIGVLLKGKRYVPRCAHALVLFREYLYKFKREIPKSEAFKVGTGNTSEQVRECPSINHKSIRT